MTFSLFFICLGIGALMGVLSGLVGIGGGVVAVPAMIYLAKMDVHMAMGTSLAIIVPVALSGMYKQFTNGYVDFRIGICIAISGILAAYAGAALNRHLDAMMLKRILAIVMVFVGVKMLYDTRSSTTHEHGTGGSTIATAEETAPAEDVEMR